MAIALDKDVVFNPISFENFVAPFQIYKQAYDQVDAQYGELSKAAQLEFQMASEQDKNSAAYRKYKAYMDGLNEAVADFSTGMTLQNRTALGNFKKRYSSDIVPVENALKRRLELSEEQRKMAQQDRTLVFEKDAKDLDLDDIIANPAIGYGKSFSGKEVAAYAANMAETLQKIYGDMYATGALTGNEYQTIMKVITTKGIDLDSLNAFLDNPNNKNLKYYKDLAPIMENIYEITGVRDWDGYNKNDYYQMLKPYLTQGMQKAIGDRSYNTVSLTNPRPTGGGDGDGKGGKDGSSSPYYNALNILLSNKYNDLKDKLEGAGLFKNGKLTDNAKKYLRYPEKRKHTYSTSPFGTPTVGEPSYPSLGTVTTPVHPVFYNEGSQLLDKLLEYAQQYNDLVHWEPSEKENKTKKGKIAISDIEDLLNGNLEFSKTGTQYLVPQRTNISDSNRSNIVTDLVTVNEGKDVPAYELDVENTKKTGFVTMKKTAETIKKSNIKSSSTSKGTLDIQGVFATGDGLYARLSDNTIVKIRQDINSYVNNNLINNYKSWTNSVDDSELLSTYDNNVQQKITNLLGDVDAASQKQPQQYE